jgi:hypothetical protein
MTHKPHHRVELFFWLVLVCAVAVGVIWIRTATVKATYLFAQQEKEHKKHQSRIQRARVNWLRLTAPARLDALARNLRLYPAKADQVLKYEK